MNGFPTTNGQVRSSAIHRTFPHYRIKKLIFINRTGHYAETLKTSNSLESCKVYLLGCFFIMFIAAFSSKDLSLVGAETCVKTLLQNAAKNP